MVPEALLSAELQRGLAAAPCATRALQAADIVVLPGYTYGDVPAHDTGPASGQEHIARPGRLCRDNGTLQAYRWLREDPRLRGKKLMVLDASNRVDHYDLPDRRIYASPSYIWAMLGADLRRFRPGVDISMPPGPYVRCASSAAREASAQPLHEKRYLASFKGAFRRNYLRRTVSNLFHDGNEVVVVDIADQRFDYDDLLYSSVFSLVLPGDSLHLYRFNEAVCSGGIPVLITDRWVAPFDTLTPFESYGVLVQGADVLSLERRLRAIDGQERIRLREKARQACVEHFETVEKHALSVARILAQGQRLPTSHCVTPPAGKPAPVLDLPRATARSREGCQRLLYPMSFEEAELLAPALHSCMVSEYALELQRGLLAGPCIAAALQDADVIVVPGYMALPCKAPAVGVRRCAAEAGIARAGRPCHDNSTLNEFMKLRDVPELRAKEVVLVDIDCGARSSDVPHHGLHAKPPFVWAVMGANLGKHRPHVDISLPPRPSAHCSSEAAAQAFLEPLQEKRILASFKGPLQYSPVRGAAMQLGKEADVVIVDSESIWPDYYPYSHDVNELSYASVFSLILPSFAFPSARFAEAVCSGGIPVLVTDAWMPPFEAIVPFKFYGILAQEMELPGLAHRLRAIDVEQRMRLRVNARRVCVRHLQTLPKQAATLAGFLAGLRARSDEEYLLDEGWLAVEAMFLQPKPD